LIPEHGTIEVEGKAAVFISFTPKGLELRVGVEWELLRQRSGE